MSSCVLDSSALLAILCDEPDAEVVAGQCIDALLSVVNLAEVYSKTKDVGISAEEIDWAMEQLQIIPFDCTKDQARTIGSLREQTREFGLSLGDRACLALGLVRGLPVVTSDQQLASPDVGVDVQVFRCRKK